MKTICKVLVFGFSVGFAAPYTAAADDSCSQYCDYLCRHYKQDLVPVSAHIERSRFGPVTVTSLRLRVKNQGQVALGEAGSRTLKASVGSTGQKSGQLQMPVKPGETATIFLGRISNSAFSHCDKTMASIDLDKSVGQWGCGVFNNDTREIRVYEKGQRRLCLILRERRPDRR